MSMIGTCRQGAIRSIEFSECDGRISYQPALLIALGERCVPNSPVIHPSGCIAVARPAPAAHCRRSGKASAACAAGRDGGAAGWHRDPGGH